ncbi:MAG: choice-of-anchor D domain-containing protein [Syntrophales bacterium]|nr:choice-of-anchor D domain-containing protein [Syntrophales bacterium]
MKKQFTLAALVIALSGAAMLAIAAEATAADAHTGLSWQGSQTCLICHDAEAREIHGSSHYQWQGPTPYTINGPETQGKLNTALNSYCISTLGNWNACGSCHVGLGAKPEATATVAQLQNVDCLICHQKEYKRKKVNGVFVPDTANMTVTMDQAVKTVHSPVRSNCLQCHAKGGGGDNNKRGDMTMAQATTADRTFDVHMSSTGANLSCQQCHTTQNHRIAGRGSDLRQTDLDVKVTCSTATCHPNKATSTGHATADINRHINRVACQTCHIPTYARNAADTAATESTEVYRDWLIPEWNAALGRWEPMITRGGNLKPVYAFWNGFSWNYSIKDPAWLDAATGAYETSRPDGGINNPGSKLHPFKYKKARQPLADGPGALIALDTAVYFATGNYDAAVKAGLVNMGYLDTTPYRDAETDTYQLITHEVMPKGNALSCSQCHTATATQMNLKGMGYAMKGTQETTCKQCHGQKSMPSYTSLHSKHVKDKGYDCSWCHSFSRPERGLKMPPVTDTTPPSVTAFGIPATATSLSVAITTLIATDNVAVTGYLLTETEAKPSAGAAGWSSAKPLNYVFTSAGAKTLHAWAKDAAGNVSTSQSANVTVTVSATVPDIATVSSLDFGSVKVKESARKSMKVTNRGTATLTVTKVELVGTDAAAFKPRTTSFAVNPSGGYELQIEFKPTARRSYAATLRIYSNDPDTPIKQIVLSGTGKK